MNAQSRIEQAHIQMSRLDEHIVNPGGPPQPNSSSISAWFAMAREHGAPFLKHEMRHNRRVQLASAVSAVAIILLIGLGFSMAHHSPSQTGKTYAIARNETLRTPSATLARQASPLRPSPQSHGFKPSLNTTDGDDMAEFLRLGGQSPSTAPAMPQGAPSASPSKVKDTTAPQVPVATQPVTTPPVTRTATPTVDPVTMAATIQAAPMSDRKQLDVLDLVTQLGAIIRDQRNEIAQLRSGEARLQHQLDQEFEDHARRLTLIEARDAIQSAKAAGVTDKGASSSATIVTPAPVKTAIVSSVFSVPTPTADTTSAGTHRYHVQAASPGVAMLSELDASGEELRQIPVAPGDNLPGWGKITSITQHGATWLVKTDRGAIQ